MNTPSRSCCITEFPSLSFRVLLEVPGSSKKQTQMNNKKKSKNFTVCRIGNDKKAHSKSTARPTSISINNSHNHNRKNTNNNKIQKATRILTTKKLSPKALQTKIKAPTNDNNNHNKKMFSQMFFSGRGGSGGAIKETDTQSQTNYEFYTNKIQSEPNGDFVTVIHDKWYKNYGLLERHHGYIQWLFPIREVGMNYDSVPLSKHEAELFRGDAQILNRVIRSYELMLDFYGLVLLDRTTGQIARNSHHYQSRYRHLNSSFHNYLRITRMMKHLGIIGFEHYKFAFLHHMCLEMFKEGELGNASDSFVRFWAPTLRKSEHLHYIDQLAKKYGRRVNREGRDGYGDEHGKRIWSTELQETNALVRTPVDVLSLDYVKQEQVVTAPATFKSSLEMGTD